MRQGKKCGAKSHTHGDSHRKFGKGLYVAAITVKGEVVIGEIIKYG